MGRTFCALIQKCYHTKKIAYFNMFIDFGLNKSFYGEYRLKIFTQILRDGLLYIMWRCYVMTDEYSFLSDT